MNKHSSLHSLVCFVDDIGKASSFYSQLISAISSNPSDRFVELRTGLFDLGFHPADEKGSNGLAVSYWNVASIEEALTSSSMYGFRPYRGPLTVGSIRIAQIRDDAGMVIGLIEEHE